MVRGRAVNHHLSLAMSMRAEDAVERFGIQQSAGHPALDFLLKGVSSSFHDMHIGSFTSL